MPKFRTKVDLVLDGETLRVTTSYPDMLWAERAMGENPVNAPLDLQGHMWYSAFRRQYPDHPAAKVFRTFVDSLDAADEIEPPAEDDPDPLDPTLEAGSDS